MAAVCSRDNIEARIACGANMWKGLLENLHISDFCRFSKPGFLLIRKDVFETMEYPWFRSELIKYEDCQEATSADFEFCLNAMKHEIPIYVDFGCTIEHGILV